LLLIYVSPVRAASAILDRGKFLFALLAAALVAIAISVAAGVSQHAEFRSALQNESVGLERTVSSEAEYEALLAARAEVSRRVGRRYFATGLKPIVLLGAVFVPFCILLLAAWDHLGGGMTILFRDYMPALAGLLFAWTAAHLPLALIWWSPLMLSSSLVVPLQIAGLVAFTVLAAVVLATVTAASMSHAAVASAAGIAASGVAGAFVAGSSNLLYMFASPWLLYYAYRMFGGDIQELGGGLSARQAFKRQLEAATINPNDSDAHYQLGMLYAQRRLPAEAERSFRRSLEIYPDEPEVLLQLGKLLRLQPGRVEEAIAVLEKCINLDPRVSSYEGWRELGAAAMAAGRTEDALTLLETYADRREYDPEGLVLYGQVLRLSGRPADARAAFQRALDAVAAAPRFRRGSLSKWASLARQEMRSL